MKAAGWQMLHALTARYHQGPATELTKYLSDEEKEAFEQSESLRSFSDLTAPAEEVFLSLHHSWLLAPLKSAPESLQSLTLSALPEEYAHKLAAQLPNRTTITPLSPPVRNFILQLFHKKYAKNLQPIPEIEQKGELAHLLDWHAERLTELGELLGLWDLSEELRRIIDKKRLNEVFQCLSPREQIFLKNCLRGRDRLALPAIALERWNGEREELRSLIFKRGVSRLGKALSGHPVETIKNLCRKLDTTTAKELVGYIQKKEVKGITPVAIQQVKQAIKFLDQQENN